jgi:hypothetical protein
LREEPCTDPYARFCGQTGAAAPSDPMLADFMRRSPLYGAEDIELLRDESLTREVELCAD